MTFRTGQIKRISVILLAVFLQTAFSSCGRTARYSVTYTDTFDTVTVFTAYCRSSAEFDAAAERVHGELVRLDRIFDFYDADSALSRLNESGTAEYDPDIAAVVLTAYEFYFKTAGKLDVSLGEVYELWHGFRDGGEFPSAQELENAANGADMSLVSVGADGISLGSEGNRLDLGAVAKGYAAGRAAESAGLDSFILNVGGNVVARGLKPGAEKWSVGIENPDGGIIRTVSVTDISVVTSGDYQRYREYEGIKYHHIIDPSTLMPSELYRSVTVICADPLVADALSTSLFCMSEADGRALASEYGAEVMWVRRDMTVTETGGFKNYEK